MTPERPVRIQVCWEDVGTICLASAAVVVPALALALVDDDGRLATVFGATLAAYLGVGGLLRLFCTRRNRERTTGSLLATMAVAWLVVPLLGAAPFAAVWWDARAHPILDACFESMSGFTSCGLTVSGDPGAMSDSLLLWRSLTQWVGGIGIAALMVVALNPTADARRMLRAEIGRLFPGGGPASVARWIWGIYLAGTVAAIVALWGLGMPAWEALNHGLTVIATGGFSVTEEGMAGYGPAIRGATLLFMLLSAISFFYYRRVLSTRRLRALVDWRVVALVLVTGAGAALLVELGGSAGAVSVGWQEALFQAGSALATAGFASTDLTVWSPGLLGVLVALMLIGGMSGSTAGGIKLDRVGLVVRAFAWRVRRTARPEAGPEMLVVERERLTETDARLEAERATTFAVAWVVSSVVGTLALAPFVPAEVRFDQVGFEVVSALGSVGLSAGVTGPDAHVGAKVVLTALMWLGRLEIWGGFFVVVGAYRRLAGAQPKRPVT